jgi:hypothetical protein
MVVFFKLINKKILYTYHLSSSEGNTGINQNYLLLTKKKHFLFKKN